MPQVFTKDNLPSDPATWPVYKKIALTHMVRIDGPFTVLTSEGVLSCEDGFLAWDSRGYPYPLAADEQARIYVPANSRQEQT